MNNTMTTRTNLVAIVLMLTAATLVVVAVGTFAATTTQAQTVSESRSKTCINDQPCKTTVSNSNSDTPDSQNVNHNRIHMSTICINDQPCQTTVSNSTEPITR